MGKVEDAARTGVTAGEGQPAEAVPNLRDITVIGGGPTGLFALFYAGMRGISARLVDSLPELGGQLTALYPEKYVFDVPGFPRVLAKDLARNFAEQALQFPHEIRLGEHVQDLIRKEGHFILTTDRGEYPTRTLLISAGKGAFNPRRLKGPGFDEFWEKGIYPHVRDPEQFRDKRVLIVGGGDSAFDWALGLKDVARTLTLVHRSDRFRAHAHTVKQVMEAARRGELAIHTFHEVKAVEGDGRVERAVLVHNQTGAQTVLEVDAVFTLLGFVASLGPIARWGIELEGNAICVNPATMMTNIPGVFAAGDIAVYDGKLELIATGAAEAAIAVNNAVHLINPKLKVNPGHSTSYKIFDQGPGGSEEAE